MKKLYFLFTAIALTVMLNACNKNGLPAVLHSSKALDTAVDVYVAGEGVTAAVLHQAVYWKDGIYNILNSNQVSARATGIAVNGTDVYVSGVIDSPPGALFTESAAYWKNGTLVRLSPDSAYSQALCVATHGSDVYVGGTIGDLIVNTSTQTGYNSHAVYWKNGVPFVIGNGAVSSIVISGSDIYAVGVSPGNTFSTAVYWKNGVFLPLPGGISASTIAIDGNDVYVGGAMTGGQAAVWKNGVPIPLPKDGSPYETFGYVNSLAVSNGNVFAAGAIVLNTNPQDTVDYNNYGNLAVLWKNASPTILSAATRSPANPLNNTLTAVFLYGADVYTTGVVANNQAQQFLSYYWKNGVAVQLPDGGGIRTLTKSIFIAPK